MEGACLTAKGSVVHVFVCMCLCWFSLTLSMIVRGALAGELGCWDSRETLFSIQAVLGEVRRRLVNSYRKPLKTPSFPSAAFPLVIPLAVLPLQ